MTYTRDDCICAPLDPEPDCPYHGNREIVVPEVSGSANDQEKQSDDR